MSECEDEVTPAWQTVDPSNITNKHSPLRLNGMALEYNQNIWNNAGFNFVHNEGNVVDVGLKVKQKLFEQRHDKELVRELETNDLITFSDAADIGFMASLETGKDVMKRTGDSIREIMTGSCSCDEAIGNSCSVGNVNISQYDDMHSVALKKLASAVDHHSPDKPLNENNESIKQILKEDDYSNIQIRQPALPEYFTARKGSDIRNNIPDVNNVRSCDRTSDNVLNCLQPKGNVMKMKKTSPGLAKRLVNTAELETATDRGDVSAVELDLLLEENMKLELEAGTMRSFNNDESYGDSMTKCVRDELYLNDLLTERGEDSVLAFSPEVEQSLSEADDRGHSENGEGHCSDSVAYNVFSYSDGLRDTVAWSFTDLSNDWSNALTMSPNLSECSEIESSISDDIDLSSCGEMPFVDDGLSVCDDSSLPSIRQGTSVQQGTSIPTVEVLQRESGHISVLDEGSNVAAKLNLSESDVADFFSSSLVDDFAVSGEVDEETVCQKQRETFDLAMRDIRHAMEKSSRNICCVDQSTIDYQSAESHEEPVWIARSAGVIPPKLQQHDTNSRCDEKAEKKGAWPLDGDDNTDDEVGEADKLLLRQNNDSKNANLSHNVESSSSNLEKNQIHAKKDGDAILIEGLLFRTSYLGSTKLISDCNPTRVKRTKQAKEAVDCIKSPTGESQPRVEVDLFVSAEKIMVLDIVRQEVMMDYALQTISYIADIDDILILMVRQSLVVGSSAADGASASAAGQKRQVKICCHVFESDEAQLIAESIGRAFQVAYAEFLRANGINDPGLLSDINYQEVLSQQQIFGEELSRFSNKEMQQEVSISKSKGEPLGIVIVESGWGSMLPTAVVANLSLNGPAAKSNQINIGDQIIAVNGLSLVGLPLSTCQNCIRAVRPDTIIRLTLVSCSPVVEVLIKRPDIKYQLGFSVQNGVICSLLRGGIGERGGVRVGHRIIEINGQSMVAVAHEKIIHSLATCVGELHMKTMQMTIFRLLTGEDIPQFI